MPSRCLCHDCPLHSIQIPPETLQQPPGGEPARREKGGTSSWKILNSPVSPKITICQWTVAKNTLKISERTFSLSRGAGCCGYWADIVARYARYFSAENTFS